MIAEDIFLQHESPEPEDLRQWIYCNESHVIVAACVPIKWDCIQERDTTRLLGLQQELMNDRACQGCYPACFLVSEREFR
jgi:hypothetical protein